MLLSAAAGLLLAALWSFHFVDTVIGENVADSLLGHSAQEATLSGTVASLVFAPVSGMAGTLTACNIAMAAALGPLGQAVGPVRETGRMSLRALVRPLALLTLGMVCVSATYGFVGVRKLLHWAVDSGNPFYRAAAFILQSIGNMLLVGVLFVVIATVTRGRAMRWLSNPVRAAVVTAALHIALGVFNIAYWDIRPPANFGYGWFPTAPYN
ncbi:hypothetical protein [Plantactinospora soyae]|uniref:Uncharacterized protein n=1 Tax=Plantactinospora soyae TaxID=1544732 RepID=A0A927M9S5_9ACTN|nr:hypothetical protein [Plantactinospora soyae]MBE1489717.1 hypothetical protein [Plantactinospora soyae]